MKKSLFLLFLSVCFFSCQKQSEPQLLPAEAFSTNVNGKKVALYTLESGNGIYMQVTNFGGRVITLFTPDKKRKL